MEISDLNHCKIRQLTREIATQLRLDAKFIEFVFCDDRPKAFDYWCEDANCGWTCFVPDDIDAAYPLWSTNADQTLLFVSDGKVKYGKGYHDNPEVEFISTSTQGLLADLFNKLWEFETTTVELVSSAEFCGFRYLDEFLQFSESPIRETEDWEPAWSRFVADIDAQSESK